MAGKDQARTPDGEAQPGNTHRKRNERRPEIVKRRREQRRREFEKQRRNWILLRAASGAVILAILIAAGWWGVRQYQGYQVSQDVVSYFGIEDYAANHVEGEVLYEQIPPVGGPHNNVWQDCGSYSAPIYNWHGVHSMEHGATWITYDPDLPQGDIDKLHDLANQSYVLVSPYPGLDSPVVASVWGKQLKLDGVGDSRLDAFIREYRINPDNTPEPGALCTQGVDITMGDGEAPQTEPSIVSGSPEEVAAAEATATAEAGGTPNDTVEDAIVGATPPPGTPHASPEAGPAATPE